MSMAGSEDTVSAMLVVKQEVPDSPDSQTRISHIKTGLEEKSEALTKTFSALCDLLHEYKAELFSHELTRKTQDNHVDRDEKLENEIQSLRTKLLGRDSEIETLQRIYDEHVMKFRMTVREKDAKILSLEAKLKNVEDNARANLQRLSNAHIIKVGLKVRELSLKDEAIKEYEEQLFQAKNSLRKKNSIIEKMANQLREVGASFSVETDNTDSSSPVVPERRSQFMTSPGLEMTSSGPVKAGGSGDQLERSVTDTKTEPLDVVSPPPVPTTSSVRETSSPQASPRPELAGVLCIKEEVDSDPDRSDPHSALLAKPQLVRASEATEAHSSGSVLAGKNTAGEPDDCSEPAAKRSKCEPIEAVDSAEKMILDSIRTPGKRTSKLDVKLAKLMSSTPSSLLTSLTPPVTSSDSGITSQILPTPSTAADPKANTTNSTNVKFRPILPRAVPRTDQTAALPAILPKPGYATQSHGPQTVAFTPLILQPAAIEQSTSQPQPVRRAVTSGVFVLQQPDGQKVILDDDTLKKVRGEQGENDALILATKQLAMYQNHENHYDKAPSRATLYRWRKKLGFYDNKIPRKVEACRHCGVPAASDPGHTSYRGWRYCPVANAGTTITAWKESMRQAFLRKKQGLQAEEEEEEEEFEEEEVTSEATSSSQKEVKEEAPIVKIELDSD